MFNSCETMFGTRRMIIRVHFFPIGFIYFLFWSLLGPDTNNISLFIPSFLNIFYFYFYYFDLYLDLILTTLLYSVNRKSLSSQGWCSLVFWLCLRIACNLEDGWGLLLHFCLAQPIFFLHSGEPRVVLCLTGSQAQFFSLEMLKG